MGSFDRKSQQRISNVVRRVERMVGIPVRKTAFQFPALAPGNAVGTSNGELVRCIEDGAGQAAGCAICPCTSDPWLLNFPAFACTDLYGGLFPFAQTVPVFFSAVSSSSLNCIWLSPIYAGQAYTWQWQLSVTALDATGSELIGQIDLLRNGVSVLTWNAPQFCCACEVCFTVGCNATFPVPCPNWPKEICLQVPQQSLGTVSCGHLCPYGVSAAWSVDLSAFFGSSYSNVVLTFQGVDPTALNPTCIWSWEQISYVSGLEILRMAALSIPPAGLGDPTLSIFGTTQETQYVLAAPYFACTSANVFPLSANGVLGNSPFVYAPSTLTLHPSPVVVDDSGQTILDAFGNPIGMVSHPPCSPSDPVSCCWTMNIIGTFPYYRVTLTAAGTNAPVCDPSASAAYARAIGMAYDMMTAYFNGFGPDPRGSLVCTSP
jgi:hypothetical protein